MGFDTVFETMPDPMKARAEYWLPHLQDTLGVGENDILIGWSSGAVAAMRYAENHKILGSILVSPSYTDLDDEAEKLSGYFDTPWQWQKIKSNQKNIALMYGDDDPYIPQAEFAYIAVQLSPTKFKLFGQGHFEQRQDFPEIIDHIKRAYIK